MTKSTGSGSEEVSVSRAQARVDRRQKLAALRISGRRKSATSHLDPESCIKLGEDWHDLQGKVREDYINRKARTGIAFSGGGIRSATLSLGIAEALAVRGRFYSFDLMSTVSGGGYCGSFLRSLFVDREEGAGKEENKKAVHDRLAFAEATLMSLPDQQYFRGAPGHSYFVKKDKVVKNPLWWLRENGRYLAPGGMSDYGFALSYIVRNWVTLVTYLLSVMIVGFALIQGLLVGVTEIWLSAKQWIAVTVFSWPSFSPLLPVVAFMALVGFGIAAGYWLSLPLSFSRLGPREAKGGGKSAVFGLVLLLLGVGAAIFWLFYSGNLPPDRTAQGWAFGLSIVITSMLVSAALMAYKTHQGSHVDFRREQTRLLARFNMIFAGLCAITLVDCLALWLRFKLDDSGSILGTGLGSGVVVSIGSFLAAKLPDWMSGEATGKRKWLFNHARQAAFAGAVLILAAMALLADVLVLKLLWRYQAWAAGSKLEWAVFASAIGTIALIVVLLSRSFNFVNLLGLTPFYGSRLTRAYLGAANFNRLDTSNPSGVTQGDLGDDLSLKAYMSDKGPAPLHLINVTRNRTVGDRNPNPKIDVARDDPLVREELNDPRGRLASYESSLTLHDRQGDRMVFGPFGVRVGGTFINMRDLTDPPGLGLLCAISGAAVGSGMGRNTSLGSSMALTLANVRLGYWWKAQARKGEVGIAKDKLLPSLSCLKSELLGRFSTANYWHLSDGGHSENSGALSLLERGCGFILVADNGEDSRYEFSDLEIFIRTARTDIGMEVTVAEEKNFPASIRLTKDCFLNGEPGDWRARVRRSDNRAFALLLKATDIPRRVDGKWRSRHGGTCWIIWLKPNRLADLPPDIATYARMNPDFPQQSTGNQFFDEAQWESYRRLGFEMGRRLFDSYENASEFLPIIFRSSAPRSMGRKKASKKREG